MICSVFSVQKLWKDTDCAYRNMISSVFRNFRTLTVPTEIWPVQCSVFRNFGRTLTVPAEIWSVQCSETLEGHWLCLQKYDLFSVQCSETLGHWLYLQKYDLFSVQKLWKDTDCAYRNMTCSVFRNFRRTLTVPTEIWSVQCSVFRNFNIVSFNDDLSTAGFFSSVDHRWKEKMLCPLCGRSIW